MHFFFWDASLSSQVRCTHGAAEKSQWQACRGIGSSDLKREYKSILQHLHLATEVVAQLQLTAFQIVAVVLVILAAKPMKMFLWSPQKGCAGSGRQLLESNSHLPHADTVLGISWSPWYWPVSWRADIRHGLQQAFKQTAPHTNGATQQVEQEIFLLTKTQLSPPGHLSESLKNHCTSTHALSQSWY